MRRALHFLPAPSAQKPCLVHFSHSPPPRASPRAWCPPTLKRHQLEAVAFVHRALQSDDGFVILADDMGMGKTLVAMQAMIGVLHQEEEGGAVLVLTSRVILEEVWRPHLRRYAPSARVHVVGGEPETRVRDLQQAMATQHVVLCTATMAGALHVRSHAWAAATAGARLVVVDECQYMTNPDSQLWQAVHARNDTPTLLMSGTPFHNQPARQLRALCRAGAAPGACLGQTKQACWSSWCCGSRSAPACCCSARAELAGRDASMHRPPLREQRGGVHILTSAGAPVPPGARRHDGPVPGAAARPRRRQCSRYSRVPAGVPGGADHAARGGHPPLHQRRLTRRHAGFRRGPPARPHQARHLRQAAHGAALHPGAGRQAGAQGGGGERLPLLPGHPGGVPVRSQYKLCMRSRAPCAAPCAPPAIAVEGVRSWHQRAAHDPQCGNAGISLDPDLHPDGGPHHAGAGRGQHVRAEPPRAPSCSCAGTGG